MLALCSGVVSLEPPLSVESVVIKPGRTQGDLRIHP
jgi:hypothetical protein